MSNLIQHFQIEGIYLGSIPRPQILYHSVEADPVGEAFWCPICAHVWGIAYIDGTDTTVHCVACEKHSYSELRGQGHMGLYDYPGSVLFNWNLGFKELPPREVLKREFLLYCKRKGIQ